VAGRGILDGYLFTERHAPSGITDSLTSAPLARSFAQDLPPKPLNTPSGMVESFVKTIKRDYVAATPKLNAVTAIASLAIAV
jgi:hypothetical protein